MLVDNSFPYYVQIDGEGNVLTMYDTSDSETGDSVTTGSGLVWHNSHWHPNYGGLYRNVTMHVMDKTHLTLPLYSFLQTEGTYVYTSNENGTAATATINVDSEVTNSSTQIQDFAFYAEVVGMDNIVKVLKSTSVTLLAGETKHVTLSMQLTNVIRWDTSYPYLYTLKCTLWRGNTCFDNNSTQFGVRTYRFTTDGGFLLNENVMTLNGYGQKSTNEWAGIGAAYSDWMQDYTIAQMKECGANYIRWGHTAGSQTQIEACNKYGILVTQPGVDGEGEACEDTVIGHYDGTGTGRTRTDYTGYSQLKYDSNTYKIRSDSFRDMIIQFRNNPSIICWELGNQTISTSPTDWAAIMKGYINTYDYGNRNSTGGVDNVGTVASTVDTSDRVITMRQSSYLGEVFECTDGSTIVSGKVNFDGEYDRYEARRGVWNTDTDGFSSFSNKAINGASGYSSLTSESIALYAVQSYVSLLANGTNIVGGANWMYSDAVTHGRLVSEVARCSGEVDAMFLEKESYYTNQVLFSKDKTWNSKDIHVIGHWDYETKASQTSGYSRTVYVVSNTPKVKLEVIPTSGDTVTYTTYTNPSNYGGYVFQFNNVVFQEGTLKAVGLNEDGNVLTNVTSTKVTSGTPSKLVITKVNASTQNSSLNALANGGDYLLFDVEVQDANGNRCLDFDGQVANKAVTFSINDSNLGTFLGGYNSSILDTIHKNTLYLEAGITRVAVRTTSTAGTLTLTATMDGVTSASSSVTTTSVAEMGTNYNYSLKTNNRLTYSLSGLTAVSYGTGTDSSDNEVSSESDYISSVEVYQGDNQVGYSYFDNGRTIYNDKDITWASVPEDYITGKYIVLANSHYSVLEGNDLFNIQMKKTAYMLILVNANSTVPNWVTTGTDGDFTKSSQVMIADNGVIYNIYVSKSTYNAGSSYILKGNNANNNKWQYIVGFIETIGTDIVFSEDFILEEGQTIADKFNYVHEATGCTVTSETITDSASTLLSSTDWGTTTDKTVTGARLLDTATSTSSGGGFAQMSKKFPAQTGMFEFSFDLYMARTTGYTSRFIRIAFQQGDTRGADGLFDAAGSMAAIRLFYNNGSDTNTATPTNRTQLSYRQAESNDDKDSIYLLYESEKMALSGYNATTHVATTTKTTTNNNANYPAGVWYTYKIDVDMTTKSYEIFVKPYGFDTFTSIATCYYTNSSIEYLDYMTIASGGSAKDDFTVSNLLVRKIVPELTTGLSVNGTAMSDWDDGTYSYYLGDYTSTDFTNLTITPTLVADDSTYTYTSALVKDTEKKIATLTITRTTVATSTATNYVYNFYCDYTGLYNRLDATTLTSSFYKIGADTASLATLSEGTKVYATLSDRTTFKYVTGRYYGGLFIQDISDYDYNINGKIEYNFVAAKDFVLAYLMPYNNSDDSSYTSAMTTLGLTKTLNPVVTSDGNVYIGYEKNITSGDAVSVSYDTSTFGGALPIIVMCIPEDAVESVPPVYSVDYTSTKSVGTYTLPSDVVFHTYSSATYSESANEGTVISNTGYANIENTNTIHMYDNNTSGGDYISIPVGSALADNGTKNTGTYYFTASYYLPTLSNGYMRFLLANEDKMVVSETTTITNDVVFTALDIQSTQRINTYNGTSNVPTTIANTLAINTWYTVVIKANFDTSKYDYYVYPYGYNSSLTTPVISKTGLSMSYPNQKVNYLIFSTGNSPTNNFYLKDIAIHTVDPSVAAGSGAINNVKINNVSVNNFKTDAHVYYAELDNNNTMFTLDDMEFVEGSLANANAYTFNVDPTGRYAVLNLEYGPTGSKTSIDYYVLIYGNTTKLSNSITTYTTGDYASQGSYSNYAWGVLQNALSAGNSTINSNTYNYSVIEDAYEAITYAVDGLSGNRTISASSSIVNGEVSILVDGLTPNSTGNTVLASGVTAGKTITVTATPDTYYGVGSVSVVTDDDDTVTLTPTGTTGEYTFTMPDKNVIINATFTYLRHTITKSSTSNGSYTITSADQSGITNITEGMPDEVVVVTPSANTGYELNGIYYLIQGSSTKHNITLSDGVYSFSMPASNITVYVTFVAINYTATVDTDLPAYIDITVSNSGTIAYGTTLTSTNVAVVVETGYTMGSLYYVLQGKDATDSSNQIAITLGTTKMPNGNITIYATATQNEYTITKGTATPTNGDYTVPESTTTLHYGDVISSTYVTITPETGYSVDYDNTYYTLDSDTAETKTHYPFVLGTTTMPNDSITLYVAFAQVTSANYTVKYYQQNVSDDNYTEVTADTLTLVGNVGSNTSAVENTYTGFSVVAWSQQTVLADGSTVVNIYYDRLTYTISFNISHATTSDTISYANVKYGTTITAPSVTANAGYTIASDNDGWDSAVVTTAESNVTYTLQITANTDTTYNVYHYQESLDQTSGIAAGRVFVGGVYYRLEDNDLLTGTTDTLTSAEAKSYTGFTSQSFTQTTILGDGSAVVNIYYNRNTYTITFVIGDHATSSGTLTYANVKYGTTITAPEVTANAGYTISDDNFGWNSTVETTASANVTYTLVISANTNTVYYVYHYKQNTDNDAYTLDTYDMLTGTTDTLTSAETKSYTGFIVVSSGEHAWSQTTILGDGTANVYIYYNRNTHDITLTNATSTKTTYRYEEIVTVTPNIPTGYHFTSWSVTGVTGEENYETNVYTFTMPDNDVTITCNYAIDTFTIDASVSVTLFNGTISPTGEATCDYGSNKTYTITANTGYHIDSVLIDDVNNTDAVANGSYTFSSINQNHTIVVSFASNTNTAYKIEIYKENIANDDFTLDETINRTGTTGERAEYTAPDITGFDFDELNTNNSLNGEIACDGSLVLKAYYIRQTYTIKFYTNEDKTELITNNTYKFGATIVAPSDPTKASDNTYTYAFNSWSPALESTATKSQDYCATYTSVYIEYSISKDSYEWHGTYSLNATIPTLHYGDILPMNLVTYTPDEGYHFVGICYFVDGIEEGVIITLGETTMPADNIVIFVGFEANTDTPCSLLIKTQRADGTYDEAIDETINITGTTDTTISIDYLVVGYEIPNGFIKSDASELRDKLVKADGSTQFVLVYDRMIVSVMVRSDKVTVTNTSNPATITGTTNVRWGTTISISYVSKLGYTQKVLLNSEEAENLTDVALYTVTTVDFTETANTDTTYKVNHYQQNLVDDNYTLFATDNMTGTTDTDTLAVAKSYTGFTVVSTGEHAWSQTNISGDGSVVINIYYTRNTYTITKGETEHGSFSVPSSLKYGTPFTTSNVTYTPDAGYSLREFYYAIGNEITIFILGEASMPASDITFTASFTANAGTPFTDECRIQKLDGTYEVLSEICYDYTDTYISSQIDDEDIPTGFKLNTELSILSITVAADGSSKLIIVFDRITYTITFVLGDHATSSDTLTYSNVRYETPIAIPSVTANAGYTIASTNGGWDSEVVTTASADVTYTLQITANTNTQYTIEYYYQDITGDGYTKATSETTTANGTTDTTATISHPSKDHFTANTNASTLSGNIEGDGSLVLKLYYDRAIYTIVFDSATDTEDTSNTYRYGATIVVPSDPTKASDNTYTYAFNSWSPAVENIASADVTYVAEYSETYINYTLAYSTYSHGTLVLGNTSLHYNDYITYTATPDAGYSLTSAYYMISGDDTHYIITSGETTMPASDVTVYAEFTANTNTTYKVNHYQQNLVDDNYTLFETDNMTGTTDTTTLAVAKSYTGFTVVSTGEHAWSQTNISGDGSVVINIYYTRNTYTVTLNSTINGTAQITNESATYKYGTVVYISISADANYELKSATSNFGTISDTANENTKQIIVPDNNVEITVLFRLINQVVMDGENTDIIVDAPTSVVGENPTLEVVLQESTTSNYQNANQVIGNSSSITVYEVTLKNNGTEIHDLGDKNVTVKMKLPEGYSTSVKVYRIDGTQKVNMPCEIVDGYIVFTTNHFSTYAIVEPSTDSGNGGSGSPIGLIIGIVAALLVAGGVVVVVIILKKKKKQPSDKLIKQNATSTDNKNTKATKTTKSTKDTNKK